MKIKFNFKAVAPIVVALVTYTLFSLIYFAPQLSGDRLVQGDTMQYRGMTQDIIETRKATGEDPQWNGSMFGGMPAYLINVEYPSLLIKNWVGSVTKIVSEPASFMIFAMVAMWLMLIMMGMNSYVAIVGGAMYGLSTYFLLIIGAGHLTKMWALVYAPLMMGSIFVTFRGSIVWGGVLTALFTSLEIGANHPQITYYFLMAAALFWLSEFHYAWWSNDRKRRVKSFAKRTAVVALAGGVALLSNLSPLYYTALHSPETIRGGSALVESSDGSKGLDLEYATAWSYGRSESINLLIPSFMGSDSASSFSNNGEVAKVLKPYNATHLATQLPTYWGDQPYTAGPTYLGAVVIMLAIIGFALARGGDRWWVVAISLIMLVLAWGKNSIWLTELLFNYLPGYDKFRTVSTALVVVEWTMPLMAALGLSKLFEMGNFDADDNEAFDDRKAGVKSTAWAVGIVGGLSLLIATIGSSLFDFGQQESFAQLLDWGFPEQLSGELSQAMAAERFTIAATDALRSVIYIVLAAAAIFSFLYGRISRVMMVIIVGILAVADLTGVATRYLNYDDFHAPSQSRIAMSNADRQILTDSDEAGYRVLNLSVSPFNDSSTSYWHRSIGGYHGAKLSRYQDLIDNYLIHQDSAVLDMLNTRYIISREQEVIKRPSALGAAWFVTDIVKSSSPHEEIAMLELINLSRTAVVDRAEEVGKVGTGGEIELMDYKPHHLTYNYSSRDGGVAIFSEIYYPKGWRLYVDGEEIPYFRANYLLRGANLPAGEHTIEWRFHSPNWGFIEALTLIGSLIIVLSLIILIIKEIQSRYVKK
ncbi:MAG: YfhO family protein [Rikenellaceae bacterium]